MADFVEFIYITKSAYYYNLSYHVPFGYVPISSSAPRPLGAAYIPILLSEVEQEQRPSGNEDREAIVVGAGLCDGEGERAYTGYAPHIIRNVSANIFSLRRSGIFFCRNVRRHVFAETSGIRFSLLLPFPYLSGRPSWWHGNKFERISSNFNFE